MIPLLISSTTAAAAAFIAAFPPIEHVIFVRALLQQSLADNVNLYNIHIHTSHMHTYIHPTPLLSLLYSLFYVLMSVIL